jgi:hypothetical protein
MCPSDNYTKDPAEDNVSCGLMGAGLILPFGLAACMARHMRGCTYDQGARHLVYQLVQTYGQVITRTAIMGILLIKDYHLM